MKDEMNDALRDPQHEELCAYVLGEADETTAARIEAALENDAALRAERDHLERTIGAVKSAVSTEAATAATPIAMPAQGSWAMRTAIVAAAAGVALSVWWFSRDDNPRVTERGTESGQRERLAANNTSMGQAGQREGQGRFGGATLDDVTDALGDNASRGFEPHDGRNGSASGKGSGPEGKTAADPAANPASGIFYKEGLDGDLRGRSENFFGRPHEQPRLPGGGEALVNDALREAQNEALLNKALRATLVDETLRSLTRFERGESYIPAAGDPIGPNTSANQAQQGNQPRQQMPDQGQTVLHLTGTGGGGGQYHGPGLVTPPTLGAAARSTAGVPILGDFDVEIAQGAMVQLDTIANSLNGFAGSGTPEGYQASIGLGDIPVKLPLETLAPGGFDVFEVGSGTDEDGTIALPRLAIDVDALLRQCRPVKGERPRDMYFRFWGDNAYVITRQDKLATFAADVDTASFVLARRYLRDGHLPEKAQIRTEEFVNYFDPDLPAPTEDDLAIHVEAVKSPFGGSDSRYLLRVGLRAKEIPREERQPVVLTFVVDNSGSMKEDNRIELVRHALRTLTAQLEEGDRIGIIAFNGEARLVLPLTDCGSKDTILSAIDQLNADGSTNAEAGLLLGYELASRALATGGDAHHRVVLLSDGVANVGETDQDEILKKVTGHRLEGIHLNTVGVGMDNHNDVFLEQLANGGDGMCDYVDDARSVHKALVERFTGAFQPVAGDVKIQVEFTDGRVIRWRQLGYENRVVADQDFRNDAVDAGEIGSGHQVTALFELEDSQAMHGDTHWATVRVRWMPPRVPGGSETPREAREIETKVEMSAFRPDFESASPGFQRAAVVAQFAEVLRRSTHARGDSWDQLVKETTRIVTLPEFVKDADTAELVSMLQAADKLGLDEEMQISPLAEARRGIPPAPLPAA